MWHPFMFQQQENEKEKDGSESTDMELEDFGLEEVSTPSGAAAGESRGTGRPKGMKAATSPTSSIVKRKVCGMLAAQRLQQQELKMKQQKLLQLKQHKQQRQKEQQELLRQVCVTRHPRSRLIYFSRSTINLSSPQFSHLLISICRRFPWVISSLDRIPATRFRNAENPGWWLHSFKQESHRGGALVASGMATAAAAATAAAGLSPVFAATSPSSATSSAAGSGLHWPSHPRTMPSPSVSASSGGAREILVGGAAGASPLSPFPAFGESPPPPILSSDASGSATAAAAVPVGCVEGGGTVGVGTSASTAPSTPLQGSAVGAEVFSPGGGVLKEGDAVEAQFLLVDQGVWTTSWYRGKVSRVNRAGACELDEGKKDGGEGATTEAEAASKKEDMVGAVYGVAFVDGDYLEEVPESHIRLYRGLQVGSVVSVEWPEKGGRPFKGCLTQVQYGEGDKPSTVSVVYEDTDTEVL